MCDIVENYAKKKVDEATAKITAEERAAGIRNLISASREYGIAEPDIVAKVAEKYNITREAALAYM